VASTSPVLGSVSLLAFPWAMSGWGLANGVVMPISQNDALYSIFGTYFGGDASPGGNQTFALPSLSAPDLSGPGAGQLSYQVSLNGTYPDRS